MRFDKLFPSPATEHEEVQPFLRAVASEPDNDITKAVFADFLEERGDERGAPLRELANAGPFIRNPERANVYPHIGRQRQYTELLCRELLGEYLHTAKTANMWEGHVGRWLTSVESLAQKKPLAPEESQYAGYAWTQGASAIRSLAEAKDDTAVQSIYDALGTLTKAKYALRQWQEKYRMDGWKPQETRTRNPGAGTIGMQEWTDFMASVARLHQAARSGLENRERAVRSLDTFLRYYKLLAMHAYRDAHIHNEMHLCQSRVAEVTNCFVARDKIRHRMRTLSTITPDHFGEMASA